MSIDKKDWEDLKAKFEGRCACCGESDLPLTMDHVIPLAQNGEDIIDNIQPLCNPCNAQKGDTIKDYRGSLKFQGQRKTTNHWYTVKHAANLLGKSPSTIKHYIRKDMIPHIMSADGKNYVWVSDEDKMIRNEIASISHKLDELISFVKNNSRL